MSARWSLGIALLAVLLSLGCSSRPSSPSAQPALHLDPASLDYGDVVAGQLKAKSFILTNTSGARLGGRVDVSGCRDFTLLTTPADYSLAAGESRTFVIQFAPQEVRLYLCAGYVNPEHSPQINLRGRGVGPP